MKQKIRHLAMLTADVLFPRRCPFCREVVGFGECDECAPLEESARRREPEIVLDAELAYLDFAAAPYWYVPPVRDAILSMKFSDDRETARGLASRMYEICAGLSFWEEIEAIVPVPSSPKEFHSRGYSVPLWLAGYVSDMAGISMLQNVLVKKKETERQVHLTGEERRRNLRKAFYAENLSVSNVLLVDDVFTTGSTLNECARALKAAGAKHCAALTVAVTRY